MLRKKRLKFKLFQKKKITKKFRTSEKTNLKFGNYGIRTMENGIVTKKQIEATRRSITRNIKKISKLWIRSRLNFPATAKSQGVRMGKGKGAVSQKIRKLLKGDILFEVFSFKKKKLYNILLKAAKKLPIRFIIIYKSR
jgi:large subunit ribosomal protein L16